MTEDAKIVEIMAEALNADFYDIGPQQFKEAVETALAALRAQGYTICPPGWKAMQREPTEKMKIAGDNAGFWCGDKFRAMWDEAPGEPT